MKSKLPTTADFKYIDMYNTWYIVNIVLIIVVHIWVDHRMKNRGKESIRIAVLPERKPWEKRKSYIPSDLLPTMVPTNASTCTVNRNAKIVIPLIQMIFNVLYFTVCMTGSRAS